MKTKIFSALILATITTLAHAQSTFNKYQPANGVQCNTGSTYVDTACTASQIPAPGSDTQVPYNHTGTPTGNAQFTVGSDLGLIVGGATGGSKGPGTLNATALYINGSAVGTSSGAVSSVALADGSTAPIFTITGSPVTAAGTLTETLRTQNANLIFAGPTSGGAAQPAFRSLVIADIPTIPAANTSGFATVATSGLYSDLTGTPTIPTGASPSATFGVNLTGANGSATTFLRSDAVLKLDPAIAPTWTSLHTFSGVVSSSIAGDALFSTTNPLIAWQDVSQGSNAKVWDMVATGGTINIRTATDAGAGNKVAFVASRSGTTVTGVALGNSTDLPAITLNGLTSITTGGSGVGLTVGTLTDTSNNITLNSKGSGGSAVMELNSNGLEAVEFSNNQSGSTILGVPTGSVGIGDVNGQTFYFGNMPVRFNGGTAASVTNPSAFLPNNHIMTFLDSGGGTTSEGFLWETSGNTFVIGNGNANAIEVSSARAVSIDVPGAVTALTVNGQTGQLVETLTSPTGTGAGLQFSHNGGVNKWRIGGVVNTTNFQIWDETNTTTALDIAPGGGVSITPNSGNMFSVSVGGTQRLLVGAGVALPNLTSSTSAQTGYLCWITGTGALSVDPTNTCLVSSIRYKQNVVALDEGLDAVMKLRPITYEYKPGFMPKDMDPGRQVGFIAEEVQKIDPRLTPLDKEGKPRSVEYAQMTALLTRAIQEQQQEIWELRAGLLALAVVSLTWLSALTWKRRRG